MKRLILFIFSCGLSLVFALASLAQSPQPVPPAPTPQPPTQMPVQQMPAQQMPTQQIQTQQMQNQAQPGQTQLPAQPGQTTMQQQVPGQQVAVPAMPEADMPVFQNPEGYHYDPAGRRDPFKPYGDMQAIQPDLKGPMDQPATPPEPLQAFDVSQFKLLGIIWQVKDPKAMVLDPSGRTHIIRKQMKIGRNNGFVAAIREGEVIVVEPSVGDSGMQTAVTRTLNLK